MKRSPRCYLALLAIGAVALSVPLLYATEAQAQKYDLKLGHVHPVDHPHQMVFTQFAERVGKETKGDVRITVVAASGLGSLDDMAEQMMLGGLAMATYAPINLSKADPRFVFDEMPYLWKDMDQFMNALHGDLGEIYKREAYSQKKLKLLHFIPFGFRHMTNNLRPIYKVEDLKGMKIRIAPSKLRLEAFKMMGVNPTPMSFGELYTALQLKTVDGQENPAFTIYNSRFYEVQKYLSLTAHIMLLETLMFSGPVWEKLPKDIQEVIQKNALIAEKQEFEIMKKNEGQAIELLKGKGMSVNDVDMNSFKSALRPLYVNYGPIFGPEIVNALKKYAGAEF